MNRTKLILSIAGLATASGCATVGNELVKQIEPVNWEKQRAISGIKRVDTIDVNLFDPRDPEKPAWWPESSICEHPFPAKGKVRVMTLEAAERACRYEFDEVGRLVSVAEPTRKIVFNYSTGSARSPESVSLDGQAHGLKFDKHGNVMEENFEGNVIRHEFGRITWPDRIVVTKLEGEGEATKVLSQKFYDQTGQLVGEILDDSVVDVRVTEVHGNGYGLKISTAAKETPDKSKPAWQMKWKDGLPIDFKNLTDDQEMLVNYTFDAAGNWTGRNGRGPKALRRIEYF